jgi:hypothetical protein
MLVKCRIGTQLEGLVWNDAYLDLWLSGLHAEPL